MTQMVATALRPRQRTCAEVLQTSHRRESMSTMPGVTKGVTRMFNLTFDPVVVCDILNDQEMSDLKNHLKDLQTITRDSDYQRVLGASDYIDNLAIEKFSPIAKELFKDDSLKMTYSIYCKYDNPRSHLRRHRDDNACTYTLDYCVSAKTTWPMWVENKEYLVAQNAALVFLGEDQTHWREDFPDPRNNVVELLFFHFAPKDHWYFTKGPKYAKTVANKIEKLALANGVSPEEIYKIPNYRDYIY